MIGRQEVWELGTQGDRAAGIWKVREAARVNEGYTWVTWRQYTSWQGFREAGGNTGIEGDMVSGGQALNRNNEIWRVYM